MEIHYIQKEVKGPKMMHDFAQMMHDFATSGQCLQVYIFFIVGFILHNKSIMYCWITPNPQKATISNRCRVKSYMSSSPEMKWMGQISGINHYPLHSEACHENASKQKQGKTHELCLWPSKHLFSFFVKLIYLDLSQRYKKCNEISISPG